MDRSDADRLKLLDRIADRVPELDLAQNEVEWTTLDDGHEALLVNGGGFDGGTGAFFANAGEDVHVVGSMAPIAEGYVGCVVIKPVRDQRVVGARSLEPRGGERVVDHLVDALVHRQPQVTLNERVAAVTLPA